MTFVFMVIIFISLPLLLCKVSLGLLKGALQIQVFIITVIIVLMIIFSSSSSIITRTKSVLDAMCVVSALAHAPSTNLNHSSLHHVNKSPPV